MKITIAHSQSLGAGWDVDVDVEAADGQQISRVQIKVNDFRVVDDTPGDDTESWQRHLVQQGVFPGDNKVEVLANDQDGKESRATQQWS